MLSKAQEKLIKSLHTKKGRKKSGLCLVEGEKVIELAKKHIDFKFSENDSAQYKKLVSTETPQAEAAVARIPKWNQEDIIKQQLIVLLDNVQDPGNVGSVLRLCLGFDASLVLVESADVTSSKVIRSSVGALFNVPWIQLPRDEVDSFIKELAYPVYRLEKTKNAKVLGKIKIKTPLILIAGSEGRGIQLPTKGTSLAIAHNEKLESLNVGHALAVALHELQK